MPVVKVVGLHFLYGEGAFSHGADAALALIGFNPVFVRELADIEVPFLAIEDVALNTGFVRHVVIYYHGNFFRIEP